MSEEISKIETENRHLDALTKLSKKLFVFSTPSWKAFYIPVPGVMIYVDKESAFAIQNYYENTLPSAIARRYYILEEDWIYAEGVNMREMDVNSFEELIDKVESIMCGYQIPQKLYGKSNSRSGQIAQLADEAGIDIK